MGRSASREKRFISRSGAQPETSYDYEGGYYPQARAVRTYQPMETARGYGTTTSAGERYVGERTTGVGYPTYGSTQLSTFGGAQPTFGQRGVQEGGYMQEGGYTGYESGGGGYGAGGYGMERGGGGGGYGAGPGRGGGEIYEPTYGRSVGHVPTRTYGGVPSTRYNYPATTSPTQGYVVDELGKRPSALKGRWESVSGTVERGMGRMFKSEPLVARGSTKKAAGKAQVYAAKHPGVAAVVERPSEMMAGESPVIERLVYYETPLRSRGGERRVQVVNEPTQPSYAAPTSKPVQISAPAPTQLEAEPYERETTILQQTQQEESPRYVSEEYSRGEPMRYRVVTFQEQESGGGEAGRMTAVTTSSGGGGEGVTSGQSERAVVSESEGWERPQQSSSRASGWGESGQEGGVGGHMIVEEISAVRVISEGQEETTA